MMHCKQHIFDCEMAVLILIERIVSKVYSAFVIKQETRASSYGIMSYIEALLDKLCYTFSIC